MKFPQDKIHNTNQEGGHIIYGARVCSYHEITLFYKHSNEDAKCRQNSLKHLMLVLNKAEKQSKSKIVLWRKLIFVG